MQFGFGITFVIAALLGAAAIVVAVLRRIALPRAAAVCFSLGIVCFVLTAGRPVWLRATNEIVNVVVDLTPATRGARFRDADSLERRIAELLGDKRYRLSSFGHAPPAISGSSPVLLFSAGRFAPAMDSPAIYPVLDALLESQTDAAITRMGFVEDQVAVSVVNNGPPRVLNLHGVVGDATETITGEQTVYRRVDPAAKEIRAELSGGDLWPENDAAAIAVPPTSASERWWVGASPPVGWTAVSSLTTEAAAYLAPSVIALNNLDAGDISDVARRRLEQYVRDLGGGLIIFGGDHAFGAGGYEGTVLGALSPLSSSPPEPTRQWILLADSSGSMAEAEADGKSRWDHAAGAMVNLLANLPPGDLVRIGQFSRELRWWSQGRSAKETSGLPLPPADAVANGPTNLEPALNAVAGDGQKMPTELVLLTDADVKIDDVAGIAAKLKGANIRLHLMAIGNGSGLPQLEQIINATGGTELTQIDVAKWPVTLRRLVSAALAERVGRELIQIQFLGEAAKLEPFSASLWDRTWINPAATLLATGSGAGDTPLPMAANWAVGLGHVAAIGFSPTASQVDLFAKLVEQSPRDPRFRVRWESGGNLHVAVDAEDGGKFLNDLPLSLLWNDARYAIPQTAPGLYELSLPGGSQSSIASVLNGDRMVDRAAIAGWYGPEFTAVGEDRTGLEAIAAKTGGRVIPPTQTTPVDFEFQRREVELTDWAALLGAGFVAGGLILMRRTGNSILY